MPFFPKDVSSIPNARAIAYARMARVFLLAPPAHRVFPHLAAEEEVTVRRLHVNSLVVLVPALSNIGPEVLPVSRPQRSASHASTEGVARELRFPTLSSAMSTESEANAAGGGSMQLIIAILALIGVLGAAVIGNWDKIFPPTPVPPPAQKSEFPSEVPKLEVPKPAVRSETPKPEVPKTILAAPVTQVSPSTTCHYTYGAKSGTTEHFIPGTPGLTPGLVGYPCTDGMGSNGVGVPDPQ